MMMHHTAATRWELATKLPQNGVVAEIGVHRGDFAQQILYSNRPRQLYLIDPWPERMLRNGPDIIWGGEAFQIVLQRFSKQIAEKRVFLVKDTCIRALPRFGRIFDWVYLDTFHLYPLSILELYACSLAVKEGGYIVGHDFDLPGVRQAISEFCNYTGWRVKLVTPDSPPSYVLEYAA